MLDDIKNAQRVLRAEAGYRGAIDGRVGPISLKAAGRVFGVPDGLEPARQVVAAAQAILAAEGFDPGPVDGFYGPQTDFAFLAWRGDPLPDRSAEGDFGRQADMHNRFGPAGGRACTAGLITVPWRMVLAWDNSQVITRIACHEKVASSAQRAFDRIAAYYGAGQIADLGLDQYGGCFNLRKMRGGNVLSTHAYGVALDFDPLRNRLNWGADRARLAQRDARPFWDAWAAEGWTSLGQARNFDWMHVQAPAL